MAARSNIPPDSNSGQQGVRANEDPWFAVLTTQFEDCLKWAKQNYPDVEYLVSRCATRSDLQIFLNRELLCKLAGRSKSYRDVLAELVPGQPLTEKILACLSGYHLVPHAAYHVVQLVRQRLIIEPVTLCNPIALRNFRPSRHGQELRRFWYEHIRPCLGAAYPQSLPGSAKDPWNDALMNIATCRLLSGLTQGDLHSAQSSVMQPNLTANACDIVAPQEVAATLPEQLPDYIDMDQAAAMVSRSKKTLVRALSNGRMPPPDIVGKGGKKHEWEYQTLRLWLESASTVESFLTDPTMSGAEGH